MSEADTVDVAKARPNTVSSLCEEIVELGVERGMVLLVHSSLSALGWVCGGAVAVVMALERVLGEEGTLVMPTHSGDLSDPSEWRHPAVPKAWWQMIRDEMPAFDPDLTPSRKMGIIAETFRKQSGVMRSDHPNCSFAAWGRLRESITTGQTLDFSMNDESPLGRIYEADGSVLLFGVGHEVNTSLHLAEYRAEFAAKRTVECSAPVVLNGRRVWKSYMDINFSGNDFQQIGKTFTRTGKCRTAKVGDAPCCLMKQRELVDFAKDWMERNRARA